MTGELYLKFITVCNVFCLLCEIDKATGWLFPFKFVCIFINVVKW